ncbi:T9SS type A sorting domain-containing protein [Taibaiella lutea]|uniref:T9SS type A sorting domain-containing protein n=1 Tax=Taibaiella lutea TaxID=2608001 RepID=A0A5M6CH41_9BACT|nr:T9SS type A sorting domain-containing protein [Taibaiella lutea]KAA5533242.1 T9SS type A sorting domain-containing protein [Taibaiella lutea]
MKKSTKMMIAFSAIVTLSSSAFAQKACNLGLTMVTPTANQEIPFTDPNNTATQVGVTFNVKNNGTAAIVPTDTIFYISEFSGNVRYITGQSIAANATVLINPNFYITNAATAQTTTNYCLRLFPQGNVYYSATATDTVWAGVTYTDADTTNDRGCVSVIFKPKATTSVFEFGKISNQQLSLYPNPANNELMFQLKLEKADKVIVSIKDITGREVLRKDYGMIQGGIENTFNLDVNSVNNGLYLVELIAGENKATGKVEIMH